MRHLARFDLNLLRIFDAIFARGGVSAAARHLHLSQPAISHALMRLRAQFDDPLFVRQGNRLVPTAAARAIAAPVREALGGLDRALEATTAFDPSLSAREFRIGVRLSGEMPRFSAVVTRLRAEAPHAEIASVAFRRRDLPALLANGDLDLALDMELPSDKQLCHAYLGREPLVVVARKGHPTVNGGIDLEAYLAAQHVIATSRPHGPGLEDMALQAMGRARRVTVRCQHAITAWQIVATTDMLFTLPQPHAQVLDTIWPMQLLELPLPVDGAGSYLYWHSSAQHDPGLSWFRALVIEAISPPHHSSTS